MDSANGEPHLPLIERVLDASEGEVGMKIRRLALVVAVMFLTGCASFNKGCASFKAGSFGSDWVVVQYRADGTAFHCWKLRGASVTGSQGGNIDWQDPRNGHLVHITGWENRVQVIGGDYDTAASLLGVEAVKCGNGVYPVEPSR